MSNYIIHNGTFYSCDSDELMHWKYVKREKKNGKWVYTYDSDGLKKDVKKFVNDPIGKKAKSEYQKAQQNTINKQNTISSRFMRDINYREASYGNGPNTTSNSNRTAREKAVNDYRRDQANLSAAKTKEKAAKEAYDKTALGKLEKTSNTAKGLVRDAKKLVKDKLGYDEREVFEKAQEEVNETTGRKATALINAKDAYDYAEKYGDDYYYKTRADEYDTAKAAYDKAVSKRDKAKESYYDTPIGNLAEAGEKIGVAKDYVEGLFKRKTTVSFQSTTDTLKELEEFERRLQKRKK